MAEPRPPVRHPPPPPPVPLQSSATTSYPILAISVLGILATAVLLVSYYVFVIKCCLNWRHSNALLRLSPRRYRRPPRPYALYSFAPEKRGLEESVIRAIPIVLFKRLGATSAQCGECAICLNEFDEDEKLRLLPGCSHAFHIDCIDTWLQSNPNCPLCRSEVTGKSPVPFGQLTDHDRSVVIEVRDEGDHEQNPRTEHAAAATDEQRRRRERRETNLPKAVVSKGDECVEFRSKGGGGEFSVQFMRRSFSMDSSDDRGLYMAVQDILRRQQGGEGGGGGGEGSSGDGRERRCFFSSIGHDRYSRNAVVLPV